MDPMPSPHTGSMLQSGSPPSLLSSDLASIVPKHFIGGSRVRRKRIGVPSEWVGMDKAGVATFQTGGVCAFGELGAASGWADKCHDWIDPVGPGI